MKIKNIYLLSITLIVLLVYLSLPKTKVSKIDIEEQKEEIVVKVLKEDNKIDSILLEEYIIGVVAAEMPASFHIEALKAQAIASRTYAMYKINQNSGEYDLTTDVTTQAYITEEEMKEKWLEDYSYYYEIIKNAVEETENLVLKYEDEIISAYYFAISNGSTESAQSVFGENKSYLESVSSSWDANVKNYLVSIDITKEEFCNKVGINSSDVITAQIKRNDSGYVETILINGKTFSGITFRNLLSLRSADFELTIGEEKITIITKGYGHGVGMSQYGANELAKMGNNHEYILNYYYQNIEIKKIDV